MTDSMEPVISLQDVVGVLQQASCQEAAFLKPAEQQLKLWEKQPTFYSVLQSIWTELSFDTNVRWLAVLCFKNGVDRYWRKTAPNAIQEEEKALLRDRLMTFHEPVNQIATQLAVLTAKIARLDCPREWPQLIPLLLNAVKSPEAIVQQRALLVLYHVVKTLASKRLAGDRQLFEELTANLISFLLGLWNSHLAMLEKRLTDLSDDSSDVQLAQVNIAFDQSILALKVLRKLTVFGVKDWKSNESALSFLNIVFERTHQFLKAKGQMELKKVDLFPRRQKMITVLTKTLLDIQENHAEAFVPYIQPSFELAVRYNFTPEGDGIKYDRFTVNTCNLVRLILRCDAYRVSKAIAALPSEVAEQARQTISNLLPPATLTEICQCLILQYFPLTADDLENWDVDPEGFICDEVGDAWKYNLRPCMDSLYLTLMKEFRDTLTPVVLNMMQQCQENSDCDDLDAILKMDAVYNAMGQASFELYDEVDFDQWFVNHLQTKLKTQSSNCRIIRRRIVWLIGCWLGVKLSASLHSAVYESVLPLLQPTEDLVVRIEAAHTLKIAVDDFEFKTKEFLPYLDLSFGLLFQLLKDVTECESKMHVLHVISFLCERMQDAMKPHALSLVTFLKILWQDSSDYLMLRCAILSTFTYLVQCLSELVEEAHCVLLPIIDESAKGGGETVCLMEDALDLWLVTLHASTSASAELFSLYPHVLPLLDLGSDTLRVCLKIIEAYIVLFPHEMLQSHASHLVVALRSLLTDLRTEGVVLVYKMAELMLKVYPQAAPPLLAEMLVDVFQEIVEAHVYPMVASMHISLFARLILSAPSFFWQFIDQLAEKLGHSSVDVVVVTFLDSWLQKTDCLIQVERKKLSAMALTSLLTANLSVVLERFSGIVNATVEALHDVSRCNDDSKQFADSLLLGDIEELPDDDLELAHEKRMRMLSRQDPVHVTDLRQFVIDQCTKCQQLCGEQNFSCLMTSLDVEIAQQFQFFLKT